MKSSGSAEDSPAVSVVIPLCVELPALSGRVREYSDALHRTLELPVEILVVEAGAAAGSEMARIAATRTLPAGGSGWAAGVRAGLAAARGDTLCYTNGGARAADLVEMLRMALENPEIVLRVNRKTRASLSRRLGSLAFNSLCRWRHVLSCWDVNGTPKIFHRKRHPELLRLTSTDDLIDLEFTVRCQRAGYPVHEFPIHTDSVHTEPPLGFAASCRLFAGAWGGTRRARESGW